MRDLMIVPLWPTRVNFVKQKNHISDKTKWFYVLKNRFCTFSGASQNVLLCVYFESNECFQRCEIYHGSKIFLQNCTSFCLMKMWFFCFLKFTLALLLWTFSSLDNTDVISSNELQQQIRLMKQFLKIRSFILISKGLLILLQNSIWKH